MSMFRNIMIANSASVRPAIQGMHFFVDVADGDFLSLTRGTGNGDTHIDWGDGTTDVYAGGAVYMRHTYSAAGKYDIQITGENQVNLRIQEVQQLVEFSGDLSSVGLTDCTMLFYNCVNLRRVAICGMENVTTCMRLFYGCSALTEITGEINLDNCSSCNSMFWICSSLPAIPGIRFGGKEIDMTYMFLGCEALHYDPPPADYWENALVTAHTWTFRGATFILDNNPDIPADWK